jgi:hypothetical protein
MKDFWQTITTHLTLLPFIDKCYREFECRLNSRASKLLKLSEHQSLNENTVVLILCKSALVSKCKHLSVLRIKIIVRNGKPIGKPKELIPEEAAKTIKKKLISYTAVSQR